MAGSTERPKIITSWNTRGVISERSALVSFCYRKFIYHYRSSRRLRKRMSRIKRLDVLPREKYATLVNLANGLGYAEGQAATWHQLYICFKHGHKFTDLYRLPAAPHKFKALAYSLAIGMLDEDDYNRFVLPAIHARMKAKNKQLVTKGY